MRYFQGWKGFFTPPEALARSIFGAGLGIEAERFMDAGITKSPWWIPAISGGQSALNSLWLRTSRGEVFHSSLVNSF
jgi:hypothetical protein